MPNRPEDIDPVKADFKEEPLDLQIKDEPGSTPTEGDEKYAIGWKIGDQPRLSEDLTIF